MTERSVQLTGSYHHRRVLQCLTGRRCKTVALVENRPAARRALRAPFQPRTLCVETIYTYQLWRFKFGITAWAAELDFSSKYIRRFQVCIRHLKSHSATVFWKWKKKKMRMISEAAVKFTFSSVSFNQLLLPTRKKHLNSDYKPN